MIGDYPLPSYACYIWHTGDGLRILFPPTIPEGRSHTVTIPLDRAGVECNDWGQPLPSQRGWKFLLDLLTERHRNGAKPVGSKSTPTQYDLDKIAAHWNGKITRIEKKKDAPPDLTLDDIEL